MAARFDPMDDATFSALLSKYPVVRRSDAVLRPPRARSFFGSSGGSAPSSSSSSAAPAAAAAAATAAPPADFWAGLNTFLEKRYGAAQGKALAAAFDSLHCAWPPRRFAAQRPPFLLPPPARPRRLQRSGAQLRGRCALTLTKLCT